MWLQILTFPDSSLWLRAHHIRPIAMANNSSNYGLETAGYIFEVASHLIGKAIVDILRENFTGDGKMQRGDFYMNQSRELLRRHVEIIRRDDKPIIQEKYAEWVM